MFSYPSNSIPNDGIALSTVVYTKLSTKDRWNMDIVRRADFLVASILDTYIRWVYRIQQIILLIGWLFINFKMLPWEPFLIYDKQEVKLNDFTVCTMRKLTIT